MFQRPRVVLWVWLDRALICRDPFLKRIHVICAAHKKCVAECGEGALSGTKHNESSTLEDAKKENICQCGGDNVLCHPQLWLHYAYANSGARVPLPQDIGDSATTTNSESSDDGGGPWLLSDEDSES